MGSETLTFVRRASRAGVVTIFAVLLVALAFSASSSATNLVTNGSFEQTSLSFPGGYFCQFGANCVSNVTGWTGSCTNLSTSSCGPGDPVTSLVFPNGSFGFNSFNGLAVNVPVSPDGGNFIAGDGDPSFSSAFSQTINGLVPGQSYTLSFYQAATQQAGLGGSTTERWQVSLGSQTQLSSLMSIPQAGFWAWNQQSMSFTATSTSEVLTFLAVGTPQGAPPVSLLDGVTLNASTPEPATRTLVATGLMGAAGVVRRRMRR